MDKKSLSELVFEKSYDEMRELSAGGAQPNLNVGKVKSTLIPLLPLAEQFHIVTRVESLRRAAPAANRQPDHPSPSGRGIDRRFACIVLL